MKERNEKKKPRDIMKYLDRDTIRKATEGDKEAMEQVVDYFKPRLDSHARRKMIDKDGNISVGVDESVRAVIELGLISAVLNFRDKN